MASSRISKTATASIDVPEVFRTVLSARLDWHSIDQHFYAIILPIQNVQETAQDCLVEGNQVEVVIRSFRFIV
ncbi:unnamed protein product [Anisakis simplex]|uniref:DUF1905 domain-containing protein n=1 Tax=Anisakis simplex TaxID=6269 RepID=A0A0M3K7Z6_ANISI|nr:unnamed protein product [Anisakis simplex]